MAPVSLLFHDVFVTDARESGFLSPAADRYKLTVADFDAQLVRLSRRSSEAAKAEPGASARQAPFRLTFDDGGVSFYTHIADRLEAHGWRGYCFVSSDLMGSRGFLNAAQLRELAARGHIIGSHSASHPQRFSTLTDAQMRAEWSRSRQALQDVLGDAVTVASVPGGYFSKPVAQSAAACGLELLFTSEPVRGTQVVGGCSVAGRFTIRRGAPPDLSRKFVDSAPWTRFGAWGSWNAKGLVKPMLGSSYPRIADWIYGGIR